MVHEASSRAPTLSASMFMPTVSPVVRSLFFQLALLFCSLTLPCSAKAQQEVSAASTSKSLSPSVAEIFAEGKYRAGGYSAKWSEDGKSFESIEPFDKEGKLAIVRQDVETQQKSLVLSLANIVPDGAADPLKVEEYYWSPDRKKLLIFTNSKRVWRYATRGDYWVYTPSSKALHRLGSSFPESSLLFAKFSPNSEEVAFVHQGNIYLESLATREIRKLTQGDGTEVISGTFDWVYEEELSLRDGFQFSQDGTRIIFWEINTEGVSMFPLVDNTSKLYPTVQRIPYPKVGTTNPAARIGVLDLQGGAVTWLRIPGDPRENYLARLHAIPGTEEYLIEQLNRLQNRLVIYRTKLDEGSVEAIYTEEDPAWVDVHDEFHWNSAGTKFTWISEKDQWRHLYWIDASSGEASIATPFSFDVIEVVAIDHAQEKIYFIASPENATQKYLYSSGFGGSNLKRLSPADLPGTHRYDISPTARYALHTYSKFLKPPRTDLIRLENHELVRNLANSDKLEEELAQLEFPAVEFIKIKIPGGENWPADKVELDAWCFMPKFGTDEKLPVILHVYGEPAGQTVLDSWGGDRAVWHAALAKQGYAVISIDNRGTPAPRGRLWRKCIYGQIGILASSDQAAALKSLCEMYPQIDPARVTIWGWSGGGSMTLNALFRYPELYQRGISIAPVPNQLYYDTIYQERYMGLPSTNAEGFRQGSPITFAAQLKGDLLLIHGTGDDNCHYQTTELLINELIANQKQFRMFAYPGRSHSINEGNGTTPHLFQMMTDFLLE